MKNIFGLACLVLVFAGGCASLYDKPKIVILQDPATMEFVDCEVTDQLVTSQSYSKNDECVESYKKKGYIVWGERK